MVDYVREMLEEFPVKFNKYGEKVTTPVGINLFKEDTSKKLNEQEQEVIHRTVAKALFVTKQGRPD